MGVQNIEQERRRSERSVRPIPVLDLTIAFRAALPLPGVILEYEGNKQRILELPERTVLLEVEAPPQALGQPSLAAEVIAAFEDDHGVAEPLFFDGGHPDTAGLVLFTDAVAAWIEQQGLLRADVQAPGVPPH